MAKLLVHYKSTIGGTVLAGLQAISAYQHIGEVPLKEVAFRFSVAALTFLFGLWAHDPKPNG